MTTSLMRRNRVDELNPWRLMEEMESRLWDWMNTPFGYTPLSKLFGETVAYAPPVDILETPENLVIVAGLPGIDPQNIQVQVQEDFVTITGEQLPSYTPAQNEHVTWHSIGIPRYGRFTFRFRLPCAVDTESAKANYKDGFLRVTFAKANKPITISVQVEPSAMEARTSKQIEAEAVGKGKKSSS